MERKNGSTSPSESQTATVDANSQEISAEKCLDDKRTHTDKEMGVGLASTSKVLVDEEPKDVRGINLSLKEVNPVAPLLLILRRWNNIAILIASGKF